MPDISKRLRKVDERVAGITRNIGMLKSRVYFKPYGATEWVEALITSFKDNGVTPKNLQTGEEVSAHRFTVKIGLNWIDTYYGQDGEWAVTRNDDTKISCDKESETSQDNETTAVVVLRISQQVGTTYASIG